MGALTVRLKAHADEVDRMAIAAHMIDANAFQKGLALFGFIGVAHAAVSAVLAGPGRFVAPTLVARMIAACYGGEAILDR
jgi:hypothetical protein